MPLLKTTVLLIDYTDAVKVQKTALWRLVPTHLDLIKKAVLFLSLFLSLWDGVQYCLIQ